MVNLKRIGVFLLLVAHALMLGSASTIFALLLERWGMGLGRGGFGTSHVPDVVSSMVFGALPQMPRWSGPNQSVVGDPIESVVHVGGWNDKPLRLSSGTPWHLPSFLPALGSYFLR